MDIIAWLAATGLTIEFVYTFLYLFYNRHSMRNGSQYPGFHRVPNETRRKRKEAVNVKDIITTGDIYGVKQCETAASITTGETESLQAGLKKESSLLHLGTEVAT